MKDRIFKVMKWTGLNLSQFADAISVSPALLSSVKSERTKPTLLLVENIKKVYPDIDINWLITGTGEMILGSSPSGLHILASDTASGTANIPEQQTAAPQESAIGADETSNPAATASQPATQKTAEQLPQAADVQQPPVVTAPQAKSVKHLLLLFTDGTYETYEKSK